MIDYTQLPKHLKLSYGWLKPRRDGTIGPTEQFSATQFDKFITCPRAWAFSYICGVKETFMSPAAALGDRIHKQLDGVYDGKPLALASTNEDERFAAERAQPALQFIPRRDQVIDLYRERTDWLDTRPIAPEIEPLQIQIKQDLAYSAAAPTEHGLIGKQWYCTDYKSVGSFDRMLKESSLRANIQGILYPADTMIRYQTPTVRGRWLYILADKDKLPEARPLDAEFEYDETLRRAKPIIKIFDYMRHLVRLRVHPNSLPPNPDACLLYYSSKKGTGGCQYRPEIFGPCDYHGPKSPRFEKPDPTITTELILAMTQPSVQLQPLPPGWEWYHDVPNNQYVPRQVQAAPPPPVPVAAPAISMPPDVPFAPPEAAKFPVPQAAPAPQAAPVPPPAPPSVPVAPVATAPTATEPEQPTKRKRRTKAEMEAARAAEGTSLAQPISGPVATSPFPSVAQASAPPAAPGGFTLPEEFDSYGEVVSVKFSKGGFVFEVPLPSDAAGAISNVVFQAVRKVLEHNEA